MEDLGVGGRLLVWYKQPALCILYSRAHAKKMLFLTSMACGERKWSERVQRASSHTQLLHWSAGQQHSFPLLVWQERFADSLVVKQRTSSHGCIFMIYATDCFFFMLDWCLYLHEPLIFVKGSASSEPCENISWSFIATSDHFLLRSRVWRYCKSCSADGSECEWRKNM